jgi:hypothetical protein
MPRQQPFTSTTTKPTLKKTLDGLSSDECLSDDQESFEEYDGEELEDFIVWSHDHTPSTYFKTSKGHRYKLDQPIKTHDVITKAAQKNLSFEEAAKQVLKEQEVETKLLLEYGARTLPWPPELWQLPACSCSPCNTGKILWKDFQHHNLLQHFENCHPEITVYMYRYVKVLQKPTCSCPDNNHCHVLRDYVQQYLLFEREETMFCVFTDKASKKADLNHHLLKITDGMSQDQIRKTIAQVRVGHGFPPPTMLEHVEQHHFIERKRNQKVVVWRTF